VRAAGAFGRENVGTSNHKAGESPARRKPKVSSAMTINGGLVGPKAMVKAAVNGQRVNIPAPPHGFDGETKICTSGALLDLRQGHEEGWQANPPTAARRFQVFVKFSTSVEKIRESDLPRKSSRANREGTVP